MTEIDIYIKHGFTACTAEADFGDRTIVSDGCEDEIVALGSLMMDLIREEVFPITIRSVKVVLPQPFRSEFGEP